MPKQKSQWAELGGTEETASGAWLANVQYRDALGQQKHIRGPSRETRYLAEQDLSCMRRAGSIFKEDREQGLKAMFYEARRIQVAPGHANDPPASQSDDEEEPADPEKIVDPDEWWQELQNGTITMDELNKPEPEKQASLEDPTEALRHFRPVRDGVERLRQILALRADPNILRENSTPLQNVMAWASPKNLDPMRNLLLQHGAKETDEDRKKLEVTWRAHAADLIRQREFFEDKREFNPWDGNRNMDL